MIINKLWKNWFVHNCIAHPLMYFVSFVSIPVAMKIHDGTLPLEGEQK